MLSLGQKIRQRRLEKNLTQTQLGEGLVSASAISQIESDKITPSYKLLCSVAERLEVPLNYFIAEAEDYLEHTTSHKLAKTFISAKEYEKALPILENLILHDRLNDIELMMDLATCYIQMNNFRAGYDLLEQVMHLSLKEDNQVAYLSSLNTVGLLFFKQNNITLAQHYWQRGYEYIRNVDLPDPFLKAEITTNLAIAYNRLGKYDRSAQLFTESKQLIEGSTNLYLLATNYLGLGQSYYSKKEYKVAEDYCQHAITLFKSLDQIRYSITVKQNLAVSTGENGEFEKALQMLHECLKEYEEFGFSTNVASTHAEIAKILTQLIRYEEANLHLEKAFQNCEPKSHQHAQCYFIQSLLHVAEGRFQDGIADIKQAIEIYINIEAIQEYNKAYLHLSNIYKKLGDYKSATEELEEAQYFLQSYLRKKGVNFL